MRHLGILQWLRIIVIVLSAVSLLGPSRVLAASYIISDNASLDTSLDTANGAGDLANTFIFNGTGLLSLDLTNDSPLNITGAQSFELGTASSVIINSTTAYDLSSIFFLQNGDLELDGAIGFDVTSSSSFAAVHSSDGALDITSIYTADITSMVDSFGTARALYSYGDLTFTQGIAESSTMTVDSASGAAVGLMSDLGDVIITNDMAGDVLVEARMNAFGLYAPNGDVSISGDFTDTATIDVTSFIGNSNSVRAGTDVIFGTDANSLFSGTISSTVHADYASAIGVNADNTIIHGDFSPSALIRATSDDGYAYGINSGTSIVFGDNDSNIFAGTISAQSDGLDSNDYAYALYTQTGTITINGDVASTGLISATAAQSDAYAIRSIGQLAITGEMDGTITATAGDEAFGMYSQNAINGGDANTPLEITGTVSAEGDSSGVAIFTNGGALNLSISGMLLATATNDANAYAVLGAGSDDNVRFSTSADITGQVDLGAGSDNAYLEGTGTANLDWTFANVENLYKQEAGTWNILEDTGISLLTQIQAGELAVNNGFSLTSPTVQVQNGGTLSGNGTVVSTSGVDNSGSVAPGASIGTLTITGDYTQDTDGVLEIEINAAGESDKLIVSGNVTLDGTLNVQPSDEYYGSDVTYTIIEAGVLTDDTAFDSITESGSINTSLSYEVFYDYDDTDFVYLTVSRKAFAAIMDELLGEEAGEYSGAINKIAEHLDEVASDPGTDLKNIIIKLDQLAANEIYKALDRMLPKGAIPANDATHRIGALLVSSTSDHLISLRRMLHKTFSPYRTSLAPGSLPMLNEGKYLEVASLAGPYAGFAIPGYGVNPYVRYIGNFGDVSADGWNDAYTWAANGIDLGVDFLMDDNLIVGANFGFVSTQVNVSDISNGDIDSYRAGLYATYFTEDWFVDGSMGYTLSDTRLRRDIVFGAVDRTAEAEFLSESLTSHLGTGYEFQFDALSIGLMANLDFASVWSPGYSESGAGDLNLDVDPSDTYSLQSGLGARLAYTFVNDTLDNTLTPEFRAEWRHEFLTADQEITANLQGNPGGDFTLTGPDKDQDSVRLGLGATAGFGDNISFDIMYKADIGEDMLGHSITTGLVFRF